MSLCARGLSLRVPGGERWLVRDLDLDVTGGRLTAIVGPNGSGKTTLLRTLVGVHPPDTGRVLLDGTGLKDLDPRERARRLAYLPQATPLAFDLPVRELVGLGRGPYLSRVSGPTAADRDAVRDALAQVEATDLADRRVSTLSGGERQRVMLARMLATGAKILVMDEPTAALDIAHVLSLLAQLRRLADDGHAIVAALHDLDLARRHADDAWCLHGDGNYDGGTAADVLTPEGLSTVFGVSVTMRDDTLRFALPGPDSGPDR